MKNERFKKIKSFVIGALAMPMLLAVAITPSMELIQVILL